MPTATAPPAGAPAAPDAIGAVAALARKVGREDLTRRAVAAGARLRRAASVVCVAGEFKQGKSSLVNALLGQDLCPVDDDLATSAITLVRHADEVAAVVRRRDGERSVAERIDPADVSRWVTEQGNPGNVLRVERVELSMPSPLLKQGIVIVDTPGMGGLGAGHAASTLSFLPFADGLVLVSDASAELSAAEVDFMRRAHELCPSVMFAQTKIDLHPAWEQIFGRNLDHLARAGLDIPAVPVSSAVRSAALARKDRALNDRSGVPELVRVLGDDVVAPARAATGARSAAETRSIVHAIRVGLDAERRALGATADDPGVVELERVKQRIEHLRGPGARWSQLLGDRVADLTSSANFGFRAAMREIQREVDERIEALATAEEWDDAVRDVQAAVADAITETFVVLEQARTVIGAELLRVVGEDGLDLTPAGTGPAYAALAAMDIDALWHGRSLDEGGGGRATFDRSMTTIRGAQGGIMMFGTISSFLPAAAGALLAMNPVILGIGALFGGLGLADDRKRKVAQRRQSARSQVRQFMDDVQFEIGNTVANLVRDVQRDLRDEIGGQVAELQRSYQDAARQAQQAAQRGEQARAARAKQLEELARELAAAERALGGGG